MATRDALEEATAGAPWFLVHTRGIVVRRERGEGGRVVLPTAADARALGVDEREAQVVERLGAAPVMAASIGDRHVPPPFEVARLRDLHGPLGDAMFMLAARATQLVGWVESHRFCGRCAARTERVVGERCMRCPNCGWLGYPRISPAVIVLVRRGDEAILARGARFPEAFYSTLAGFVEIGESLEETISREVREEVGVDVKTPRYFGSQPWPFPHSLMVGFFADWAGGEIEPDGREILDARWFRVDRLPAIPPPLSIARHLIDAWIAEVSGSRRSRRLEDTA